MMQEPRDGFNYAQDFQDFLQQQNQQNNPNYPNVQGQPVAQDPEQPAPNNPTNADGNWDIGGTKKDKGNSEGPSEIFNPQQGGGGNPDAPQQFNVMPPQPQTISPPSPEAHMGPAPEMGANLPSPDAPPAQQTPPIPSAPTPNGMTGAAPAVQPLAAPDPKDMIAPAQQFDMLGKNSLSGSAGGLLGGGLGTGGQAAGADSSNILPLLLQLLAQQGQ